MLLYKIAFLIIGLLILIGGGEFLVRGASRIALRLHLSPLVVGLTIVAFGTSAPELFISVQSALDGSPDMAMGNVIGSNICNLALVLGITAVVSPIDVHSNSIKIDWPMAMGSSVLLFILVRENYLVRIEGLIFVAILILYIIFLIRESRKEHRREKLEDLDIEDLDPKELESTAPKAWFTDIGLIILGCAGLYFGSEWFVNGSRDIFKDLGVSDRIIGIVVLALGTSLPELVTSIVAAIRKNTDLAIGNLMGSNIFNVLSILGITSIIKDIHVSTSIVGDMYWMIGVTLLVFPLMFFNRRLGKLQGGILLSVYFYYTYSILATV
ncbi:calcium/sodium antiporter [Flexithrix dorotheae]|uniref:calcium/sodium antiporter n=1 Tax=Flexithrix dorotheae TaxID=70993 RepID=UPI000369112E|nr:calcium/sodium antiporter [Flexithrix dorotheae]